MSLGEARQSDRPLPELCCAMRRPSPSWGSGWFMGLKSVISTLFMEKGAVGEKKSIKMHDSFSLELLVGKVPRLRGPYIALRFCCKIKKNIGAQSVSPLWTSHS